MTDTPDTPDTADTADLDPDDVANADNFVLDPFDEVSVLHDKIHTVLADEIFPTTKVVLPFAVVDAGPEGAEERYLLRLDGPDHPVSTFANIVYSARVAVREQKIPNLDEVITAIGTRLASVTIIIDTWIRVIDPSLVGVTTTEEALDAFGTPEFQERLEAAERQEAVVVMTHRPGREAATSTFMYDRDDENAIRPGEIKGTGMGVAGNVSAVLGELFAHD